MEPNIIWFRITKIMIQRSNVAAAHAACTLSSLGKSGLKHVAQDHAMDGHDRGTTIAKTRDRRSWQDQSEAGIDIMAVPAVCKPGGFKNKAMWGRPPQSGQAELDGADAAVFLRRFAYFWAITAQAMSWI